MRTNILFVLCLVTLSAFAQSTHILPTPQQVEWQEGFFVWNEKAIDSVLVDHLDVPRNEDQAYRLTISNKGILMEATTETGLFYARQSLTQLHRYASLTSRDGTIAINLPAIQDFETKRIASYNKKQDCRYVLNRNEISLRGKVIETEEGYDREYGHYTKYKGVIIGNYSITGRWSSIGEDARHLEGGIQDKTTSFTAKYENHPRDGQTPDFSKFELYHFTEADFDIMEIVLIGDGEEVKNFRTNDKPSVKKIQLYSFTLTTDLTKSPDLSGSSWDWK